MTTFMKTRTRGDSFEFASPLFSLHHQPFASRFRSIHCKSISVIIHSSSINLCLRNSINPITQYLKGGSADSTPVPSFYRDDTSEMARRLFSCFGKSRGGGPSYEIATADLTTEQQKASPVVVELFSSQGCATSPEAELLFSRLGRGDFNLDTPLILLAYHVDYWDYMGWKDPFGSSQWTVRQKAYVESLNLDTMFTPQIVVQGRVQCMATDSDALLSCIASSAPRFAAPSFQVKFEKPTPDSLQVSLTGTLRSKVDNEGAAVMVALYECGLVTNCPSGANKDRVLANEYVVRRLEKLCSVKDIVPKKTLTGTVNFSLWDGFNSAKCGLAIFVESPSHQILGSQKFQLPGSL